MNLAASSQALRSWMADQLHLPASAPLWLWVWRLFVLHPSQRPSWGRTLGGLVVPLAWALAPAWAALRWGPRVLGRLGAWLLAPVVLLSRLLTRAGQRLDADRIHALGERLVEPLNGRPVLRRAGIATILVAGMVICSTPMNWAGQLAFGLLCWALAMMLREVPGRLAAIAMTMLSFLALGRYGWWRFTTTLEFDSALEAFLGYGLLLAEFYTWLILTLGFIQTAWPLQRKSVPLEGSPSQWPTVDVFVPTYNEPLSVIHPVILAALALDWPADRLRIYILDDGRRDEFRDFADRMGVHYIRRENNRHAKAGNLNHALPLTEGELIAIFDCDHIPTRDFLKSSVGFFLRDPKCAMVQTPHHFFSADPFERNLGTFRRVPKEGSLFYGLVQDGNDLWNSTFFCGSCAVIRRAPLLEIGGIAVETVTEDAHTALKLHRRGYSTAYLNRAMAAGLATESLAAHIGQRIRWARGMAQIFRIDNPLLGRGLSVGQRICYLNAMLHFFFGVPRLVFLTAPLMFLLFGLHIIAVNPYHLLLYVGPYLVLSSLVNSRTQGQFRHSFWAEVYETVLAWYLTRPTLLALLFPKSGRFNVTAKGGVTDRSYFDWQISRPYLVLVALNALGVIAAPLRLIYWNGDEVGTVLMNLAWSVYSLIILGATLGVAAESRQVRKTHRVAARFPASLSLPDGQIIRCECVDYSMAGLRLQVPQALPLEPGEPVHVGLWREGLECSFPAVTTMSQQRFVALQFEAMGRDQEVDLIQCTFARADAWSDWNTAQSPDRPLESLREIAVLATKGFAKLAISVAVNLGAIAPRRTWRLLRRAGS